MFTCIDINWSFTDGWMRYSPLDPRILLTAGKVVCYFFHSSVSKHIMKSTLGETAGNGVTSMQRLKIERISK